MFVFVIMLLQQNELVKLVRSNALDGVYEWKTVSEGLESYRWFHSYEWSVSDQVVVFRGEIKDEEAVKAFEERHKYTVNASLKAIQLSPYYGLDEDKDMLSFTIRFLVNKDGKSFRVKSGSLGVRSKKNGEWREKELGNKSLVEVIKGCYRQRDPYMSLVEGLPFK